MSHFEVLCLTCKQPPRDAAALSCPACGGPLGFRYEYADVQWDDHFRSLWRYWRLLPINDPTGLVTLDEGNTPLLRSRSYPAAQVCNELRLFHSAGLCVTLRQYPCGDELTTLMLADMNRWIMEQVCPSAAACEAR